MLCKKGQGFLETILTLPIAATLLATVIALGYRAALFSYVDYQLHEALVCMDDSSARNCEGQLRTQLKKLLLFQESLEVYLSRSHNNASGTVRIQKRLSTNFFFKVWPPLEIKKDISFPLKSR